MNKPTEIIVSYDIGQISVRINDYSQQNSFGFRVNIGEMETTDRGTGEKSIRFPYKINWEKQDE